MQTPQSFGNEGSDYPYIVLVGDAGSGKSEIATILAHPLYQDLNWAESESEANKFDIFWTYDGSMAICDTPDNHLEEDKFKGNIQLAAALAFKPVSQILIVVRARPDLDGILKSVRTYSKDLLQLEDFDKTIVGIILTKSDKVSRWFLDAILDQIEDLLGIENVIVYSKDSVPRGNLLAEIESLCVKTVDILDNYESFDFLILFDIHKESLEVRGLADLRGAMVKNQEIKREFDRVRKECEGKERADLLFEFQTWMEQKTLDNSKEVTWYLAVNRTLDLEKLRLLEMVKKQMRLTIFDIYLKTAECHIPRRFDVRRCPFCNAYWRNEDIKGFGTCGEGFERQQNLDALSSTFTGFETKLNFDALSTFTFKWQQNEQKLYIRPSKAKRSPNFLQFGCGGFIRWRNMPQVNFDQDLKKRLTSTNYHILKSKEMPIPNQALPVQVHVSCETSDHYVVQVQENVSFETSDHYVVLMGEGGVGKSTIVEKLTGVTNLTGETLFFRPYETPDWTLTVADVPGSNLIENGSHWRRDSPNLEIAAALDYKPVSLILITVRADLVLGNVLSVVKKFSERLLDFSDEVVGVLVTHMDSVSWENSELETRIKDEFGIECVLFSKKDTPGEMLLGKVKSACINPAAIKVDEKMFQRLFKINDKNMKIQKEISKEIGQIKKNWKTIRSVLDERGRLSENFNDQSI